MNFPGIMLNEDNSHYFYSRAELKIGWVELDVEE